MTTEIIPRLQLECILLSLTLAMYLVPTGYAEAGVASDGTMGPAGPVTGPDYSILDTSGRRAGANLFHSFSQFNIGTGESATFSNSGTPLNNVIARVTGGASSIDGLIRSTIDGANLFLLNPAGIMFGPNASIDVSGSFHASTADYLKFSDNSVFYSNPSTPSVLSVAEPVAFGFLGPRPAAISGDRAFLQIKEGMTLSLIGGDIAWTGTLASMDDLLFAPANLAAPGGTINLVSVASPGEVGLADMGLNGFTEQGKITFSNGAKMSVTNQEYLDYTSPYYFYPKSAGGKIVIRGGEMLFSDGGIDAYGNPGGSVDIQGVSLQLDNYYMYPNNFNWWEDPGNADQSHPGTACRIDLTGDFLMTHSAFIGNLNLGAGSGGNIKITAQNVLLGDEIIDANSYNSWGYYGYIGSTTLGSGKSGDIDITAENMVVRHGFFANTQSYGEGNPGNIYVNVGNKLTIQDQGSVGITSSGSGHGGTINVSAHDVLISAQHGTDFTDTFTVTGILGQTFGQAFGGQINLVADRLQLLDGGQISSVLRDYDGGGATGKGTDVNIHAREMVISGYVGAPGYNPPYSLSSVDARVFGSGATGQGGNIGITTDNLTLTNGGNIRTGLYADASGNAGNIDILAGTISISNLGQIYADSFRGTGDSGDIVIKAQNVTITGTGGAPPPAPLDFTFTGISTSTKDGRGGLIAVDLDGDLAMTTGGGIKADTGGSGTGGSITIMADNVSLAERASINAASSGSGDAGDIAIATSKAVNLRNSTITTEASVEADGGNISITAPYMIRLVDSQVTSSVGGGPETTGGNIFIDPQFVILQNSQIIANAYEGTGGNIRIIADVFLMDPSSTVSASSALGVDGSVDIQSPISNVSGFIAPLGSTYVSATDLLRERCIVRLRQGKYSSFIISGRDGLPLEPGGLMPSVCY